MASPETEPVDIGQTRLDNALRLFDEFARQHVRSVDAMGLRGLERRFAEHLLVHPSYWSQIKSGTRRIGERLARQFEQRCRKPAGWMDRQHPEPPARDEPLVAGAADMAKADASSVPRDDDERFIAALVLSYYRRHPQRARNRLLDLLGEVLAPPHGLAGSSTTTAAAEDDAGSRPTRGQRHGAALKRKPQA